MDADETAGDSCRGVFEGVAATEVLAVRTATAAATSPTELAAVTPSAKLAAVSPLTEPAVGSPPTNIDAARKQTPITAPSEPRSTSTATPDQVLHAVTSAATTTTPAPLTPPPPSKASPTGSAEPDQAELASQPPRVHDTARVSPEFPRCVPSPARARDALATAAVAYDDDDDDFNYGDCGHADDSDGDAPAEPLQHFNGAHLRAQRQALRDAAAHTAAPAPPSTKELVQLRWKQFCQRRAAAAVSGGGVRHQQGDARDRADPVRDTLTAHRRFLKMSAKRTRQTESLYADGSDEHGPGDKTGDAVNAARMTRPGNGRRVVDDDDSDDSDGMSSDADDSRRQRQRLSHTSRRAAAKRRRSGGVDSDDGGGCSDDSDDHGIVRDATSRRHSSHVVGALVHTTLVARPTPLKHINTSRRPLP